MRFKQWLLISTIVWVISAVVLGSALYYWDPFTISSTKESLFYLILILQCAFLFNLILTLGMHILGKRGDEYMSLAIRQGFLYAMLVSFVLFLQSRRLFSWWNLTLFIIALSLIELLTYFVTHEREH